MYYMLMDKRNIKGKMSAQFVHAFYYEDKEQAEIALAIKCEVIGVPNDESCFEITRIYPAVSVELSQAKKDYYNRPAHSKMEYPG